jgi:hypothetical protein
MSAGPSLFNETSDRVRAHSLSVEDADSILDTIDFSLFSLDQMEPVEDADWIPDDVCVRILRTWTRAQEENMGQIRSYLAFTPTVSKSLLLTFVDAIFQPHQSLSLTVENVIYLLATGGGTRPYENPIKTKLISVFSDCELTVDHVALRNLFSGDPAKFFRSQPKPNASFVVHLPPFLHVAVTSYTIRSSRAEKADGLKCWTLEGSLDNENWFILDTQVENMELAQPSVEAVFRLERKSPPCQWFRLTQKNLNHAKTLCIVISGFDVSGEVKLVPTQ